jgi:hypothetical protein
MATVLMSKVYLMDYEEKGLHRRRGAFEEL